MNEIRPGKAPETHPTPAPISRRRLIPPSDTPRPISTRTRRGRAARRGIALAIAISALALPGAAGATDPCRGLGPLRRTDPPPFATGEELDFRLTFGGAYVGHFEAKVGEPRRLDGRTVLPLFGRARTSMFVASFQPMTGRYMAMVDPETLEPFGLQTELRYGEDDRWEKVRFTGDGREVQARFRLKGAEHDRRYTTDHDLTDILTLLYLARTIDLKPGLEACQDVFSARRLWRMTARVLGLEDVSTPAGRKRAYHVKLHFLRKPHPSLRTNDPPEYDLDVFLSADAYQTPLEFTMRLEGGTAGGRLERWRLGG